MNWWQVVSPELEECGVCCEVCMLPMDSLGKCYVAHCTKAVSVDVADG